jgi:DNA-binding NarL/FixJ family response regulator
MAIRIVIADDHTIVRAGIRSLLAGSPDIDVVGEARNGVEALRLVRELNPDVLVLDMEMPGLKGLDVARQLRAANASVRILALSAYDDQEYINGLLENGASGYLLKEDAPSALIEAVRGIARGEQGWISRRIQADNHTGHSPV